MIQQDQSLPHIELPFPLVVFAGATGIVRTALSEERLIVNSPFEIFINAATFIDFFVVLCYNCFAWIGSLPTSRYPDGFHAIQKTGLHERVV